jgi:DNA-binding SARP family transcriptional activator
MAYLVLERRRSVSRMELVALLWPHETPFAWEAGLSAVLSRVRSAAKSVPGCSLEGANESYRLRLPVDAWVDVGVAVEALDGAEGALRAGRPRGAFGRAVVASTIARRPFLADTDVPWAAGYRARLQRVLVRSLEALAQVWVACAEPHLAVETAIELLAQDGVNERGYQLLIEAHSAAGHPADALAAYRRLKQTLRMELGTDPSPDTERLYERLLR